MYVENLNGLYHIGNEISMFKKYSCLSILYHHRAYILTFLFMSNTLYYDEIDHRYVKSLGLRPREDIRFSKLQILYVYL